MLKSYNEKIPEEVFKISRFWSIFLSLVLCVLISSHSFKVKLVRMRSRVVALKSVRGDRGSLIRSLLLPRGIRFLRRSRHSLLWRFPLRVGVLERSLLRVDL
jgi:hypothetical protein